MVLGQLMTSSPNGPLRSTTLARNSLCVVADLTIGKAQIVLPNILQLISPPMLAVRWSLGLTATVVFSRVEIYSSRFLTSQKITLCGLPHMERLAPGQGK